MFSYMDKSISNWSSPLHLLCTHTGQSPSCRWWCRWRGRPAGRRWSPSWPGCRRWRWGRPGWRSSGRRRPCRDRESSTSPSLALEETQTQNLIQRDKITFGKYSFNLTRQKVSLKEITRPDSSRGELCWWMSGISVVTSNALKLRRVTNTNWKLRAEANGS